MYASNFGVRNTPEAEPIGTALVQRIVVRDASTSSARVFVSSHKKHVFIYLFLSIVDDKKRWGVI